MRHTKFASIGLPGALKLSRVLPVNHRNASAGFSLIEVVVALAVLATTVAAVGALITTAVRGTRSLEQRLALIETARAIEAALPNRRELLVGDMTGIYGEYRWRIDALPFTEGTAGLPLSKLWVPQQLVIEVRSSTGASIRVRTVRLLPRGEG